MEDIEDLAKRWLELDHDTKTRNEITNLMRAQDEPELERRLRKRIAFGTAGLRGPMKAGFAYMNSLTVLLASNGLARYITGLQRASGSKTRPLSVVIGYDARHNSEKFARLAAVAFLDDGFEVLWFGRLVHTPLVPFSVQYFGADVGVMITASHNPKNDNGYKVYTANGCQIIPPHDAGIAAAIEKVVDVENWDGSRVDHDSAVTNIYHQSVEAYFDRINTLTSSSVSDSTPDVTDSPFMYTPMHGVGLPFMTEAARSVSQAMLVVAEQAKPDPEFPTVPFPNPEEKGALDLAKSEAEREGCSLILANDPDADRFAVMERLDSGHWHQFTGNQMGVLLASHVLDTYTGERSKLAMLASTVSSRMLAAMAVKEGFHFQETLTGFKWLGNVAQNLQRAGYDPVYAYEEAIGYMFSSVAWDKDGIAAAAAFLTACTAWRQQGLTPWTKLQSLYQQYGYFEDANTYLISRDPETTNKVFSDIRRLNNGSQPESIGSRAIKRWRDLTIGFDSGTNDHKPILHIDASAQMITCELDGVVFTARGSGTEPKIKLYIEAQAESPEVAKPMANEVLQDLLREWFKPEYGLKLAET